MTIEPLTFLLVVLGAIAGVTIAPSLMAYRGLREQHKIYALVNGQRAELMAEIVRLNQEVAQLENKLLSVKDDLGLR